MRPHGPSPDGFTRRLDPRQSQGSKLRWSLGFAVLFWLPIGLGLWAVFGDGRGWSEDWFILVALGVFSLAGLSVLWATLRQGLALANPSAWLELPAGPIRPGDRVPATFHLEGAAHRLERLTLTLEGRRETVVGSGKARQRKREPFYTRTLLDSSQPTALQGTLPPGLSLDIPDDAPPSSRADRESVVWEIRLHGEVRRGLDVLAEYPVEVEGG
jgi:hypothetical protein